MQEIAIEQVKGWEGIIKSMGKHEKQASTRESLEEPVTMQWHQLPEYQVQEHINGLNAKQGLAMKKIIQCLARNEQMIMFLTGKGGTGKSELVRRITGMFRQHGREKRLSKVAFTGTAAFLIGGRTLQADGS